MSTENHVIDKIRENHSKTVIELYKRKQSLEKTLEDYQRETEDKVGKFTRAKTQQQEQQEQHEKKIIELEKKVETYQKQVKDKDEGLERYFTRETNSREGVKQYKDLVNKYPTSCSFESTNKLLVVAIDIGTTFSGFAFSFHNMYLDDPTKVHGKMWRCKPFSLKAPTCILLKPDKTFAAFGYDAEDMYADLVSDGNHKDWCFVKHFKMQLHKKKLNRDITVEDVIGNKVSAMMIFAETIKYLKDEALQMCKFLTSVEEGDVIWVLTTPTIWSDAAKMFMREAANKAGIDDESLYIALEPEVASMYCKQILIQRGDSGASTVKLPAGSQYVLLDAGGGTIDVVVLEINEDGTSKEIHQANGGPWGGTAVDEAFREYIIKIIGNTAMKTFRNQFPEEYLELMRTFEMHKHDVSPESASIVRLRVSTDLKELIENKDKKSVVEWNRDKMRLTADTMRTMFEKPVKKTVEHIESLLDNNPSVTHVLMVGGFSESPMLQKSIRSALEGRNVQVVVPDNARQAVLTGAVIYGHSASFITHRTSRCTYGIETMIRFEEGTHDENRRYTDKNGKVFCKGCFDILVEKGQSLRCSDWLHRSYSVVKSDQTAICLSIYASNVKTPTYIDDPGSKKIGDLCISMPDTKYGLDRGVDCQFCLSGPEFLVRTIDKKTKKTCTCSINFLG